MTGSQLIVEDFESAILKDNPLGDPHTRKLPVYLPAGYQTSGQRYPVVYVLSGYTGQGLSHLNVSPWDETLPQRMDRLMASGQVRPMIVVMPDCFTKYGGSQYINSTATGRYEDMLIQELVPFIDSHYRTLADRDHRVVLGKSSGGYGAMVLGMRHPDVFGLVVDHSGDKYFELGYKTDFPKCLAGLLRFGGAQKFLEKFPHPAPRSGAWFDTISMLAMAACYSPNPDAPLGFDLPFDEQTGEIDAAVWARWLEHDPVELLPRHADALRSLRLLFLDCGMRDEYHLQWGARIFAKKLRQLGIPHLHEEFEDGHRNIQYRYDRSFAVISQTLAALDG